jgi:hypothetical protein
MHDSSKWTKAGIFIGLVEKVDGENLIFRLVEVKNTANNLKVGHTIKFPLSNKGVCRYPDFNLGDLWLYDSPKKGSTLLPSKATQKNFLFKIESSDLAEGFIIEKVADRILQREYPDYYNVVKYGRKGMTWGVLPPSVATYQFVNVDCAGLPGEITPSGHNCDPYNGDTQCSKSLPILCVNDDVKDPFPRDHLNINPKGYHGWFGGKIDDSIIVKGSDLTSRKKADYICSSKLGDGWRMASFHDGNGWGFWARGQVKSKTRFWVAINDQPANCWD